MPYYKFYEGDEETDEMPEGAMDAEKAEEDGAGDDGHTYEPEYGSFDPEELEGVGRLVHAALVELGVGFVGCSYDGGGDEGFAHFDVAAIGNARLTVDDLSGRLADGPLGEIPEHPWIFPPDYFHHLSRSERVKEYLDHFAFTLAEHLLGDGYGTGEYSMYGSFVADLTTGAIDDQEI